jgi:hypothetical protein
MDAKPRGELSRDHQYGSLGGARARVLSTQSVPAGQETPWRFHRGAGFHRRNMSMILPLRTTQPLLSDVLGFVARPSEGIREASVIHCAHRWRADMAPRGAGTSAGQNQVNWRAHGFAPR